MSKYMTQDNISASDKATDFQMKCEENLTNYKAMVQNNYDKMISSKGVESDASKSLAD